MAGVQLSGSTATVGAGTRLIDFYSALTAQGRAVPGGSCPTVGISGLTLGGGVGVVARAYGLTSDNLQSLQLVTADGQIRTCNASENADLFWACRGGGGGNFGVATSFTFGTHPAGDIVVFFLYWPWAQAEQVLGAWQSWAPNGPDQLWSNMHLSAAPGGGTPTIEVGGTYIGSVGDAYTQLEKLYAAIGSRPSSYYLNNMSWLDAMLLEAGCSNLTVTECHLPTQAAGGQLSRASEFAKSDIFTAPLNSAGIGTLLSGVENLRAVAGAPGGSGGIAFDSLGGRGEPGSRVRHRLRAQERAVPGPVHDRLDRPAGWRAAGRGAAPAHLAARVLAVDAALRERAGIPELHRSRPDHLAHRLLRRDLARLTQIKAAHDPGGVFSFPQAL
jgi:hypothetical protein